MRKTFLVTGGAGFIGSNFAHYIYNKYPDSNILVLDFLTYAGSIDNLPVRHNEISNRFEFWYGDVRDSSLVESMVAKADIVVHFAAETHVTRSIFDNRKFFEIDVLGTQSVANAVLKNNGRVEKFIHISSSEVYGTAEKELMDENHPLNPTTPYAAAKAGADRLVYSYFKTYDIPAVILRPFNNYGPRQHLEKVIPRFVTSCILGEDLHIHGEGLMSRDWIYVEDTCEAIDRILNADISLVKGESFNIGTGQSISIKDLACMITDIMKVSMERIKFVDDRPGQVDRHTADLSKIKNILGWSPKTGFESGIMKTIEWYKNNRQLWEKQLWLRNVPIVLKDGRRVMH
ncbi:MAG: GDP-mannose 4,6-dehydratase [Nitrospirota bacterium]